MFLEFLVEELYNTAGSLILGNTPKVSFYGYADALVEI